jgi:hypothetical protein
MSVRGALNEAIEGVPKAASVAAAGCCGQAQDHRAGVSLDDLRVCVRRGVVRFVYDNEIGGGLFDCRLRMARAQKVCTLAT